MKYLLIALLLIATPAIAKDVTLSWDASPSSNVVGYKVYYSTNADVSDATIIDSKDVLTYKISGVDNDVVQYFAVTAYDATGFESAYSNIVNSPVCVQPSAPSLGQPQSNCTNINIHIGG